MHCQELQKTNDDERLQTCAKMMKDTWFPLGGIF